MSSYPREPTLKWPARFNEIPKEVFHREDVYRLELERIFGGPDWHMVAHRSELAAPGDYKTAQIGETQILLAHGNDGVIRAFANSCAHRGAQLATCSRGHASTFQCPYHRWSYKLSGELLGAPGSEEFPSTFRKEDHGLRAFRSAEYLGIIFVTANAQTPALQTWLDDTKPYFANAIGDGRLRFLGYQKTLFDTNWKSYCDNEGYHGPLLHTALRLLQFPKAEGVQFMTRNAHKVNNSHFPKAQQSDFLNDFSLLDGRDPLIPPQNTVISLFPMSLIVRNLDALTLRYAFPVGPERTEVHYAYFGHESDDEALTQHRIRQGSNLAGPSGFITLEDGAVFNRQQIGSHTPGTIAFQKGVKDGSAMVAPCQLARSDEAGNLIRWERYRALMGFDRE
jgi:phenylpropionate dioxygenase-like ring-hydroxylating dioxygenase large terminal subunit